MNLFENMWRLITEKPLETIKGCLAIGSLFLILILLYGVLA